MSYRRISFLLLAIIALAGVPLYLFVLREDSNAVKAPTQGHSAEVIPVFDQIMEKALNAYNRNDSTAFLALFSSSALPTPNVENYQALFNGVYRDEFGKYKSGHILSGESVPNPEYGVLVYEATFEKHRKVKVSANFVRANGETKLAQLRFEKF